MANLSLPKANLQRAFANIRGFLEHLNCVDLSDNKLTKRLSADFCNGHLSITLLLAETRSLGLSPLVVPHDWIERKLGTRDIFVAALWHAPQALPVL